MKSLKDQILDVKTEAKNQRDRGLKGYPRALRRLSRAIDIAKQGLLTSSVTATIRELTQELADCYGMAGGVERRWGLETEGIERREHLSASCIAYDEGYRYEWDPKYGTPATYNLVNRLTSRLLIEPRLLEVDEVADLGYKVSPINIKRELNDTIELIDMKLANKGNYWVEGDLALLRVLTGKAVAVSAYEPFFGQSPPDFAFGSALDGIRPLAAVNLTTASSLQDAVALLESKRRLS
jgi:hypothetical protein